ncbi:MAG: T9SS type A sorting domain-containing protein [Bacteroidota bacterium]
MKTKLLYLLFSFSTLLNSQTFTRNFPIPQISQAYTLGSTAPIVTTSDGGYILHYSYGYPDLHGGPLFSEIIKTDAAFLPLWKKVLYGSNGKKTFTFGDGSIILSENAFSQNNISFSIEKLDANGNSSWRKYDYEVYPNKIDIRDAIQKDNNTIKFAGVKTFNIGQLFGSFSTPVIMDFDLNGNFVQGISLTIPSSTSPGSHTIESICKEPSGNYYVFTLGLGSVRHVAKFSPTNTLIWCKQISFNNYNFSGINSTVILSNGDLLIGGSYNNYSLSIATFALMRITSNGTLVWSKTINDYKTVINGVQELSPTEIIVTGSMYQNYLPRSIVMKVDANGNTVWAKKYSNAFTISEVFRKASNDWYYAAFSYSLSDGHPFIFNTENNGNTVCTTEDISFNFVNNPASLSTVSITVNPLSLLTPLSITNSGQTETQSYVDNCLPLAVSDFNPSKKCVIYPNPSNGLVNISSDNTINKITINTILGQTVNVFYPNSLESNFTIESSGMYLVTVETDFGSQGFKVLITK